jgi:hypothetical protein
MNHFLGWETEFHPVFNPHFAKMRKIKNLKGLFCCNIPVSSFLKLQHFEKQFELFSAHLEYDF